MTKTSRISFAFAVLILLAAAALRLTDLPSLPPGLHAEEIVDIRWAENARQGDIEVFYQFAGQGRDGLYPVMLAAVTSSIGSGSIGYRLPSLWISLITLALVYAVGRRLYGDTAGLAAMGLLAVSLYPTLLGRWVGRETLLPLLTVTVLMAAALALPIYWRPRSTRAQTAAFSALGALLGLSFYVHPAGLFVPLFMLLFTVWLLRARRWPHLPLGYIAFAALVALIVATPYLVSSIRLPELSGATRLIFGFQADDGSSVLLRPFSGLLGLGLRGDLDPAYNLPGRPLFDPLSALLILLGVWVTFRRRHKARYALLLSALLLMLPALLAPFSPFFPAYAAALPVLALSFGVGVNALIGRWGHPGRVGLALTALLSFNMAWTSLDLVHWATRDDVDTAFNGDVGRLARRIDLTAGTQPTLLCADGITNPSAEIALSPGRLMTLMLNRSQGRLRFADCDRAFVIINGGDTPQQIIRAEQNTIGTDPAVLGWLDLSLPLAAPPDAPFPEGGVLLLEAADALADKAGRFITTAPVLYAPEAAPGEEGVPISPPVRFENNLTFLGYDPLPVDLRPGDVLPLVTYWRVDGPMPPDLLLFAHVQDDPGARPVANADLLDVVPVQMRSRDVFVQVLPITLPPSLPPREYLLSVGAYQRGSGIRANVLPAEGNTPLGSRLVIGRLPLQPAAADDATGDG